VCQDTTVHGDSLAPSVALLLFGAAGLLRGQRQPLPQSRSIYRILVVISTVVREFFREFGSRHDAIGPQQLQQVLHGVFSGRMREFICERMNSKRMVDVGHGPEPADARMGRRWPVFGAKV